MMGTVRGLHYCVPFTRLWYSEQADVKTDKRSTESGHEED